MKPNRRTFLGMLAGLFGAGAAKKLIPWSPRYSAPNPDWENAKMVVHFKYYINPNTSHQRMIFHKRQFEAWNNIESKWNSET